MEIKFDKTYLQELYEIGKTSDKKHWFQPQIVTKYQKTVTINTMSKYICARPVHPGEVLKDEIEYRGISQEKLAAQMGISYKTLNNILNELLPVTASTAILFETVLDIPADSLIRIQDEYNLQIANQNKTPKNHFMKIRKTVAVL